MSSDHRNKLIRILTFLIALYIGLLFFKEQLLSPILIDAYMQQFFIVLACVSYFMWTLLEIFSRKHIYYGLGLPVLCALIWVSTPGVMPIDIQGIWLVVLFVVLASANSYSATEVKLGSESQKYILHIIIMLMCLHNFSHGMTLMNDYILCALWLEFVIWMNHPVKKLCVFLYTKICYYVEIVCKFIWGRLVWLWKAFCAVYKLIWGCIVKIAKALIQLLIWVDQAIAYLWRQLVRFITFIVGCAVRFFIFSCKCLMQTTVFMICYSVMASVMAGLLILVMFNFYIGYPLWLVFLVMRWCYRKMPDYVTRFVNWCFSHLVCFCKWSYRQWLKLVWLVFVILKFIGRTIQTVYVWLKLALGFLAYAICILAAVIQLWIENTIIALQEKFEAIKNWIITSVLWCFMMVVFCIFQVLLFLAPYAYWLYKKAQHYCAIVRAYLTGKYHELLDLKSSVLSHPRFAQAVFLIYLWLVSIVCLSSLLGNQYLLFSGVVLFFVLRGLDEYAQAHRSVMEILLTLLLVAFLQPNWFVEVNDAIKLLWLLMVINAIAVYCYIGALQNQLKAGLKKVLAFSLGVLIAAGCWIPKHLIIEVLPHIAVLCMYVLWHEKFNRLVEWGLRSCWKKFLETTEIESEHKKLMYRNILMAYFAVSAMMARYSGRTDMVRYVVVFFISLLTIRLIAILASKRVVKEERKE